MGRGLNVSRSGYYDWLARSLHQHVRANHGLDKLIREIFIEPRQCNGAPRIAQALRHEGLPCTEKRIALRMRTSHLQAIQAKKFKATTESKHLNPSAPDLLKQDFRAEATNQKWTSAITYVWTDERWLYLAVVMDLYSRAIVGWAMNRRMTQHLVCDTLTMAVFRRGFPKGTIRHSDRGSQYRSMCYQRLFENKGQRCSMGHKATCSDNPITESFFHTLKGERIHREGCTTRRLANLVSLTTSKRITIDRDGTQRSGIRSRYNLRRQLTPPLV